MNAVSLYCTDKSELFGRMRIEIAKSLKSKSDTFLKQLTHEFDLEEEQVAGLRDGKIKINFALFDLLKGALGISIQAVLGTPNFTPKSQEFWEKQCWSESPMFFAAPSREAESEGRKGVISDEERKRMELDLYVRLRAIDELAWDK